ncbi:MAG: hypothetical protein HOQ44_02670 [Nocardia sp.]|nr:hypothetical protein [Nocardia sp.]
MDDAMLRMVITARAAARESARRYGDVTSTLTRVRNLRHDDRSVAAMIDQTNMDAQLGARGAVPPSGRFPPYTPSPAEQYVASRQLEIDYDLSNALPNSSNGVYVARDRDSGVLFIYKPFDEEKFGNIDWIPHTPGQLAIRDVLGYRVFEMMRAPLVPPTALVDGPFGPGSSQLYVPMKYSKYARDFPEEQGLQAAAGHSLIGNADGRTANFRPKHDGNDDASPNDELVLYDHSESFPEDADPRRGNKGFESYSAFARYYDGSDLPPSVLDPLKAITDDRIGSAAEDLKLSDNAIDRTLERLHELQSTGEISSVWS